jgi:hypothetical protein
MFIGEILGRNGFDSKAAHERCASLTYRSGFSDKRYRFSKPPIGHDEPLNFSRIYSLISQSALTK